MGAVVRSAKGTEGTSGCRSGGTRLMGENTKKSVVRRTEESRRYSTAIAIVIS